MKSKYTEINPMQLVPALEDNDFKLAESVAIFRYLANKYEGEIPDYWYPKDAKKQAQVDEYLEWQHANTRSNLVMYFKHKLLIPLLSRSPPDEKQVALYQLKMESVLDDFENIWLKDNDYIAGQQISIADIAAICELQQPGVVGYDVLKGRPKLTAWYKRVSKDLNPELEIASKDLRKFTRVYPLLKLWVVYGGKLMKTFGFNKPVP